MIDVGSHVNLTMEPIAVIVSHYFPRAEFPPDDGREWIPMLCPSHDEERPSCNISYSRNAINCQACGFKGDVISIVKRREGVSFADAVSIAERILAESGQSLPGEFERQPSRRTFGGAGSTRRGGQSVRSGVRGRTTPWT